MNPALLWRTNRPRGGHCRRAGILGLVLAAVVATAAPGEDVVLANERLTVRFAVEGAVVRLVGLQAAGETRNWLVPGPAESVCRLTLQRIENGQVRRVTVDTATASACEVGRSAVPNGEAVRFRWTGLRAAGLEGALTVEAGVELAADSALSHWRLSVQDDVPGWGVESVVFPAFRVAAGAQAELASPRGLGKLYRDPVHFRGEPIDIGKGREMAGPFPWGHFSMQLLSLTEGDRSLYMATHDPLGKGKYFHVAPAPDETALEWRLTHYPEEPLRSPCEWACSYPTVIGLIPGDWWHACRVYRQWAIANAEWTRPPAGRPPETLPDWLPRTPLQDHSYYEGMDETQGRRALPHLVRTQELYGGFPMLVQYPCWNTQGFDIGYPDFFPARDWYAADAQTARQRGLQYCPYINVLSLDVRSEYWRRGGAEQAFLNPEIWPKLPEHGLVWVCPQSAVWEKDFAALVERVARELAAAAVYVDQAGVIHPLPCYAPGHGHPVGNQSDTAIGVRRVLTAARRAASAVNPALVLSGEGFEECTGIELPLLCNHTLMDMDCPMAMAVYADRLDPYGYMTTTSEYRRDPMSWRMKLAEEFVYGLLLGTAFGRPSAQDRDVVALVRDLAGARVAAAEYLATGEMMHPPRITGTNPDVTCVWETYGPATRRITRPQVRTSSWLARDGSAAVAFANIADRPATVGWALSVADLGLASGTVQVEQVWPAGATVPPLTLKGPVLGSEVTVPALGALVLRLKPDRR